MNNYDPKYFQWYNQFREKAGLENTNKAIIIHAGMYMCKDAIKNGKESKEAITSRVFPNHSPKNRQVLLKVLESIIEGENFPDLSVL